MDTHKDDGLLRRLLEHNADLAACLEALLDKQPSELELAQARYILAVAKQAIRRGRDDQNHL